ncbi:SHOCT domain-containing protein [Halospina sp. K52047b]|uniref:SHOCT domain-containing protein n=1 Tax=Halospina sp. K52047b TaxID=2614160 RepID=UPI001249ECFE|nr:SHOCT domain-containing protein [Halospina sp. K52047b]KAA8985449.1 SHOCT domain-containing protein [Halospina sp. K52047b]
MGPEHFWWGGWGMFPMIMPITMLIIALIMIYLLFGRGGPRSPGWENDERRSPRSRESESAIEILKKRYARGEISREDFEQMRKDLED